MLYVYTKHGKFVCLFEDRLYPFVVLTLNVSSVAMKRTNNNMLRGIKSNKSIRGIRDNGRLPNLITLSVLVLQLLF